MKILYIGRFELPDKDATANRIVSNAKLLQEIGHEVVLAGWSTDVKKNEGYRKITHFGFETYEKYKEVNSFDKFQTFSNASHELHLLRQSSYDLVIAYNYPAVALKKIMRYCKRNGIRVICDVSEWFANRNKYPLFRVVRMYDSYLRMKVLHKKADGLIVISRYLQNYYKDCKTVLIPPLVDINDPKWAPISKVDDGICRFVYAGWPSKTKERLDIIVNAVSQYIGKAELNIYGIDEQKYRNMYDVDGSIAENIHFHGRVSHLETVEAVKSAHFSVIIRENCRKNDAGFPSKMVESIASGTPVIITDISNVKDYVGDGNNGFIVSSAEFGEQLAKIIEKRCEVKVAREVFDYHNFIEEIKQIL
ncbi:MAG: glycosyltransferase [Acutalibacteraceae bacterium]|nr:glycosyltransferase [Acutalibacteraceae bacterium]